MASPARDFSIIPEAGTKVMSGRELKRVAAALGILPINRTPHRAAYNRCCFDILDADEGEVE